MTSIAKVFGTEQKYDKILTNLTNFDLKNKKVIIFQQVKVQKLLILSHN